MKNREVKGEREKKGEKRGKKEKEGGKKREEEEGKKTRNNEGKCVGKVISIHKSYSHAAEICATMTQRTKEIPGQH